MTGAAIIERLDSLTRSELADRLRVHRNSMGKIINKPDFPQPAPDGKWLLSEIIGWENGR